MTASLSRYIKWLILSLLIVTGFNNCLSAQTSISGVINQYARVTSIGADFVVIDDETQFDQFAVGDTVLLMQMKGVLIFVLEDNSYGSGDTFFGEPGKHEFLTILLTEDATNTIVFRNNIINTTFDVQGDVQLIKVPSYNYAKVDATLTCQPWDSTTKTGGVLAAIIGRTISVNASIDVTGKGFKGGEPVLGKGICSEVSSDWKKYSYPANTDSAGNKGEGLAIRAKVGSAPYPGIYPEYAKGKGANYNGGGGGNGKFSGGGGGANYGQGGTGGLELNTCTPNPNPGGRYGYSLVSSLMGRLFLGGGGGSSTYTTGVSVSGGNGGGIVILIADTLRGNGYSIIADGGTPGTATGDAGAGGGGGGGSVSLYIQSYSDNLATSSLFLSAKGGKGGSNAGNFGEGAGGGGGYITTNNITLPANVSKTVSGGERGDRPGAATASPGLPGQNVTTFTPVLNGFLFNSIVSSVTGNQVDSICSNVIPPIIVGTNPAGTGPFTYEWQKTYNFEGTPSIIAGADSKNYEFTATESDTLWIRRIVTDNGSVPLVITDTSKWVNIIVQPAITDNLVGKDTTICYNQDPLSLEPLNAGPANGNGIYQYQWIQSLNADMSGAGSTPGTSDQASYDPPALTDTTYFKRVVTSGRCVDQSSTVIVTVLPSVTGNGFTDRPDSIICEGSLFDTIIPDAPGGGSGSYAYLWQDSIPSATWIDSPYTNDVTTYTPDTIEFATIEQRYYRRVVFSGPDSVCKNNSPPVLMTRYHRIENNTISKDTTICSGTVPPPFTATTPGGGSLIYTYMWQDSSKTASWTTQGTSMSPYSPSALTDSTWYRRIVNSSECSDTSNILVINVHKPVANNIASLISASGSDTTICSGAVPNKIKGSLPTGGTDLPGDYAYQWLFSTDNSTFTDITGANNTDYQPESLAVTTWFKRKVISGKCFSESNTIEIIVLPEITNNIISDDQTICYGTTPAQLTGTDLTGGAGGTPTWLWEESSDGITWTAAEGTNDQRDYSPPALTDPMKYRRIIFSGSYDCCIDTSAKVEIGIYPLPTGTITSVTDTTICNGQQLLLKVNLTGASPWTLIYKENSAEVTVDNITSSHAVISRVPDATAAKSIFNYSLVSVVDDNGCMAASLAGTRKADVYRVPVAVAGPDDAVCGPEYTLAAVPSDGTGKWIFPANVLSITADDPNSVVKIDSSFTDASDTLTLYWEETNWQCIDKDDVTVIFYNRIDNAYAGSDISLFSFDYIMELQACPTETFETHRWSVVEGTGDFDDDTCCSTIVRNISKGSNKFKWTVTNGECMAEDIINVAVYDLLIPEGFSPNDDPEGYNNEFIISGLDLRKELDGQDSVPAYQIAELTIVNGAGIKVFTTSNKNGNEWKNWDGRNSHGIEMPEGTYYYLLKITSVKVPDQVFKKSGFIILKRY